MDAAALYQRVLGRVVQQAHDRHLAEDVAQEAFLRLSERLNQNRVALANDAQALAWLLKVARNILNDRYRSERKERKGQQRLTQAAIGKGKPEPDSEIVETVRKALFEMNGKEAEALRLRVIEEKSYGEIAVAMKVAEGTVASWIFRARRLLKRTLKKVIK